MAGEEADGTVELRAQRLAGKCLPVKVAALRRCLATSPCPCRAEADGWVSSIFAANQSSTATCFPHVARRLLAMNRCKLMSQLCRPDEANLAGCCSNCSRQT